MEGDVPLRTAKDNKSNLQDTHPLQAVYFMKALNKDL